MRKRDPLRVKTEPEQLLDLHGWTDYYVLGVACAKLGLCAYARAGMDLLSEPDLLRLFNMGEEDAHHHTLQDVAYEIGIMRENRTEKFDELVAIQLGPNGLEHIKQAILEHQTEPICRKEDAIDMLRLFEERSHRESQIHYVDE